MDFLFYDITFLIIFCIAVSLFLYKNRKKVEVESKIIFLYKTKMGLDKIEHIRNKYHKLLSFLEVFVIILGYMMMVFSVFVLVYMVGMMFTATSLPRVAPIIPLIPYMPELFNLDFLPPFYFTYWIITIAIIAVGHEFAHGVFARLNRIRLKSTGFGFIGPLLAAFVELDEKQMAKKPVKAQLSVLAAGATANLLLAILFLGVMNLFFMAAYVPNGAVFNMYGMERANITSIYGINGLPINNFYEDYAALRAQNVTEFKLMAKDHSYYATPEILDLQLKMNLTELILFSDSPAYRANLTGAIQMISVESVDYRITDRKSLESALAKMSPGQEATVRTTSGNYSITFASHPQNSSKAYLGIMSVQPAQKIIGKIVSFFNGRDTSTYYDQRFKNDGNLTVFIYNLLFWIVFVNFSVMFVNMLPFAIFDGGRFFYLTVLTLTGSSRKSALIFKIMNWAMLVVLVLMMIVWYVKAY